MALIQSKWTANDINKSLPKAESANFTAIGGTLHIVADGSGPVTATLPAVANGLSVRIKTLTDDISADTLLVVPASGTIDGSANYSFNSELQTVLFISDGVNWFIS